MNKYILEIASFTLEGALTAAQAGAQRIELCENPQDGGTTPSYGMLKKTRKLISIPVFPIIRPRGGDFVYSNSEVDVMKEDILLCKELGYQGVVLGLLDVYGNVDIEKTAALVSLAAPMQVTFHRAFDRTANAMQAMEDIINCGCKRILTSGQRPSIENGKQLVKQLIELSNSRITIMPGSGLNSQNVAGIAQFTQATEFHTAARKSHFNDKIYSSPTMNENQSHVGVDENEVKKIRRLLDTLNVE
jgi:copper homeostasis protein